MIKNLRRLYPFIIQLETLLVPNYLLIRTNPEFLGIKNFMIFAAKKIKRGSRILDAGAGTSPYKNYFKHTRYESTDFKDIYRNGRKIAHTFNCSIDNIPKPKNYYDAIINTQVLEHVEYPDKVIKEFYRVLKPGGKLFLTAPQGWGIHEAPFNFYYFTYFGLKSLFENAGFKIVMIKPRGGIFWFIGTLLRELPSHIYYQLFTKKGDYQANLLLRIILAILIFPLFFICKIFLSFIIPLIFYYLDFLDRSKIFTLGYNCYCVKKA